MTYGFVPPSTPKAPDVKQQLSEMLNKTVAGGDTARDYLRATHEPLLELLERLRVGAPTNGAAAQIRAAIPQVEQLARDERSNAESIGNGVLGASKMQAIKDFGARSHDSDDAHDFAYSNSAANFLTDMTARLSQIASSQQLSGGIIRR
jgi:hypothetical protein